jgi:UDP-3-O-[3-hydroxymyristoyl] glucosamine N-acyltransferase
MAQGTARWTLNGLAQALGGEAVGPGDLPLERPAPAGGDDPLGITFAESGKYLAMAENSAVGAVIVGRSVSESSKPIIRVDNPRAAFGMVLAMSARPLPLDPGVHAAAVVDGSALIDPTASVGPFSVVCRGARIGPGVAVHPHCYVGENCVVGSGSILMPGVVLYQDVEIGERCLVHSGAVMGADGFGFAWDGTRQVKIPQVGGIRIGNDVEIGAGTTIDRATAGKTCIGDGAKLDNLIQIAHNTNVGRHTVIAAQSGISGSSRVGERNTLAGRVAISDHVSIGDDVVLGGRTGVLQDIKEPGIYLGYPAQPFREAMRSMSLVTKLPELLARLKKLEARVKELEGGGK